MNLCKCLGKTLLNVFSEIWKYITAYRNLFQRFKTKFQYCKNIYRDSERVFGITKTFSEIQNHYDLTRLQPWNQRENSAKKKNPKLCNWHTWISVNAWVKHCNTVFQRFENIFRTIKNDFRDSKPLFWDSTYVYGDSKPLFWDSTNVYRDSKPLFWDSPSGTILAPYYTALFSVCLYST